MKTSMYLAAAVAALTFTAAGNAGVKHVARWHHMTLHQKRVVVAKTLARERSPVRWWLRTRHRVPESSSGPLRYCRAANMTMPGTICVHAQRAVNAKHVLDRIDAKLDRIAVARFMRVAGNDFETAAHFVDRIFPGTYGWLMSCSSSEGGHGQWVWNGGAPYTSSSHGSGAGGWMQFMEGTFYGNVDGALLEARAHGFPIPSAARSWTSPLGQAVTAAWIRYHHRDGGSWTGASC